MVSCEDGHRIKVGGAPFRAPKMGEILAAALRRQIVLGELKEGDSLPPEMELMSHFNVSRPTLREGFRILESEGLIVISRGSRGGARIQFRANKWRRYFGLLLQHQQTTLADVYAARTIIEAPSVRLLANHRTERDLELLWSGIEAAEASVETDREDPERYIRTHIDMHELVVELAGNQTLRHLAGLLREVIQRTNLFRHVQEADSPAGIEAARKAPAAHRRLIELIEAGDADAAEALWRRHLTETDQYVLSWTPRSQRYRRLGLNSCFAALADLPAPTFG